MSWNHKQSIKEVIKHFLYKSGAQGVLGLYRQKRGFITSHLQEKGASERFREIYRLGTWIHEDGQEARSGLGSEAAITGNLVTELPDILRQLECKTLLDVGCGDWNWMSSIDLPCDYIGVDIVPEVIEANKCHEKKGVRFLQANASEDELPVTDVVLCREVLFHLSFRDSKAALANIKRNAKWIITTTDTNIWFNSDIPTGDYRKINLQRKPYSFPVPYNIILDNALTSDRILGIWKTEDLVL